MEKSLEQLKHIERISRQTRHHRTHLNQIYDQHLRVQLNQLANEREQIISRSSARRELEEERQKLLTITIEQIATQRQHKPLPNNTIQTEEETIQVLSKNDESRPTSSVRFPSPERSCRLFSHNCQLYPCQPIYRYTSIIKKEHDQILRKRESFPDHTNDSFDKPYSKEKKLQQDRHRIMTAMHNQDHQVHRYVSMQRTMARLDEQSRLLHERLADKKLFGYNKERQYQLSKDIQRHLNITTKFCT